MLFRSHVYPGLILSNSNLGLVEVNSVRATADAVEIGEFNSNIKSLVAYNTDSKVINTLKTNGVVLANVVPQGGIISGSSSTKRSVFVGGVVSLFILPLAFRQKKGAAGAYHHGYGAVRECKNREHLLGYSLVRSIPC